MNIDILIDSLGLQGIAKKTNDMNRLPNRMVIPGKGTQTLNLKGLGTLDVELFSKIEHEAFERLYPSVTTFYTLQSTVSGKHAITDLMGNAREVMRLFAQAAKADIEHAGTFCSDGKTGGFTMTSIRPDDLIYATITDPTFNKAVSGLTAGGWYGLWHSGAFGASLHATKLKINKYHAIAMIGMVSLVGGSEIVDNFQIEMENVWQPVETMGLSMHASDFPMHKFRNLYYFKPEKEYRTHGRFMLAGGQTYLYPIGVAFKTNAEVMKTLETQPA